MDIRFIWNAILTGVVKLAGEILPVVSSVVAVFGLEVKDDLGSFDKS